MADLPQVGAEIVLDTDSYDKSINDALSRADELDSALNDLGGTIDATVDVDTSALNDLEDTAVDIEFNVDDSELPFDEIPDETNTDVNVTETEDATTAVSDLHFMANLKRIETVMNIAGNVLDVVEAIGGMVVTPFLDIDDAVARINAQTGSGTGIDDLAGFIRDVQAADLGDSVDQISDVVIAATQLHAPIEEATTAALTFTHTFKDQDPVTVMTSLKSLADEFGISISDASDLMTVFFQQGGNKGGDALATVEKYSQSWKDMGLTIPQALSAVTSLMGGGVDTADSASKMIQTFDDALTAAAADSNSQQAKLMKVMGVDNPKDAGKAIGAETIDGFASAFANLPADQQDLVSGLFFGKTGKLDTSAIAGLTTQSDMFKNVTDAAAAAATEIDNSLRGAIDDFMTEVNTKVAEVLSSDAIDLPGKIEALKKGLQDALNVLASGGSIGEAIEIGLNIPGFNDSVSRFEASIGNFVISVMEIIASVQDFLGKDSSGTRRQIAQAEEQQLPFNLKVANSDEIAGELQTAIDRGLSTSDIAKATGTAFNELIAGGDIDKAQALVDSLNQLKGSGNPMLAPGLGGVARQEAEVALRMADNGDTSRIQEQLDKGNLIAPVSLDTTDLQKQIDDAKAQIAQSKLDFGPKPATPNPLGPLGAEQGASVDPFTAALPGIKDSSDSIGTMVSGIEDAFMQAATSAQTTADGVQTATEQMTTAVQTADTTIATALTDNTVTASFDAVAASAETNFPVVIDWMQQTAAQSAAFDSIVGLHLRSVMKQLNDANFLALQVIANVTSAQALGGGGSTTNNTTNNVTVTNNNSNGAQTSNSQYQLAQQLGGG